MKKIIGLFIFFFLFIPILSRSVFAVEYRRQLTIDNTKNTNDLTDYQVSFLVNTKNLISLGRIRSDCTDIHIKDNDDKVEIKNLWIENCNNNATKIWVKVPKIPASTKKNIYMYYGTGVKTSDFSIEKSFIRTIDGVIGAYTFDNANPALTYEPDVSGNGRNGSVTGSPAFVSGKFNKARNFDASDDMVVDWNMYRSMTSIYKNFSMEAWFYPTSTTWGPIFYSDHGGTDCWPVAGYTAGAGIYASTGGIYIQEHTGCWLPVTASYYTALSGWNHVVLSYIDGTPRIYLNGTLVSIGWNGGMKTFPSLHVGNSWGYLGIFYGMIDEPRVYNRPLTIEEIKDIYNNYGYVTLNYLGKALVRKFSSPDPTVSFTTLSLDIDIPDKNTDVKNNNKVTTNYKTATFTAKTIIAKRTPPSVFDNRVQIILDNNIVIPFKYDHEEGEQTVWQGTYKLPSGITNKTKPDGLTGSLETLEYGTTTANTPVTTTTHFQNLQPGFINSGYVVDFDIPSASVGAYTTDNSTSSAIIDYSPVNISSSNNDIIDDFISMFRALIQSILIRY